MAPVTVTTFGAYTLHEQLGSSERGAVYRATLESPQRNVALKRVPERVIATKDDAQRLSDEVARAALLRHPNIVPTFRVGWLDGTAYVEMEHVAGTSVEELLREARMGEPPPIEAVVSIAAQLCSALACAHDRNIVHGDLGPSHLMVDYDGRLRALGFGMSSLGRAISRRSYAAPEILADGAPDARADVFSVGAISYELVTGRPLFDDQMDMHVRELVASQMTQPSAHNAECPVALDQLVVRALATEPDERWSTATEMADVLDRLGGAQPQVVRDWLELAFGRPPQRARLALPLSPSTPPPPPPRTARGSSRLVSLPARQLPLQGKLSIAGQAEPYVVLEADELADGTPDDAPPEQDDATATEQQLRPPGLALGEWSELPDADADAIEAEPKPAPEPLTPSLATGVGRTGLIAMFVAGLALGGAVVYLLLRVAV